MITDPKYQLIRTMNNEQNSNFMALSIELLKKEYENSAGNQDYYYNLK